MAQLLLIPDPRPLEERLGGDFFRQAPEVPGVYLMRDAADRVLYVGKAKNLRQRLQNYRVANPDRMPRRHLRMLRQVARIEFQFCAGETSALRQESKLLRSLKPRFNRAGVWPGKSYFLLWRGASHQLEITAREIPEPAWQQHGPMGREAQFLCAVLARLIWLVSHPQRGVGELPPGWTRYSVGEIATIPANGAGLEAASKLETFFGEEPGLFVAWLQGELASRSHPFERAMIDEDLEWLTKLAAQRRNIDRRQFALL